MVSGEDLPLPRTWGLLWRTLESRLRIVVGGALKPSKLSKAD